MATPSKGKTKVKAPKAPAKTAAHRDPAAIFVWKGPEPGKSPVLAYLKKHHPERFMLPDVEGAVKALKVKYTDTPTKYARWRVGAWLKSGLIAVGKA